MTMVGRNFRRFQTSLPVIAAAAFALTQSGCAGTGNEAIQAKADDSSASTPEMEVSEADEDAAEESVVTSGSALSGVSSRSDAVKAVALNSGLWGDWTATKYCPEGSYAVGYRMRVESGQGDNDDTALNAVELKCMNRDGYVSTVSAHDGLYGSWYESAYCTNGKYLNGGAIRFETSRRSGDDTAGNSVRGRCSDGTDIQAPGGLSYGGWNSTQTCESGASVCGIKVRFEGNQGSGDDTALNAVEFACCKNSATASPVRVTERTMDGVHARTYSPDFGAQQAPLLLVEGFDIDNSVDLEVLENSLPSGMISELTKIGYSVTLVDLTKNWESIRSNALRVGNLANQIWAESTQARPIKLVGASMGGLVVTTAAAMKDSWAELGESNPGWNFNVDHVTTVDTPNAGAYIPEAIYHFLSRFNSLNSEAGKRFSAVTSTAAKQMMLVPFNSDFQTTHETWQAYYAKVLQVMRKSNMRFVAVVDGAWNDTVQDSAWTAGYVNLYYKNYSVAVNIDAWLMTQPKPGGNSACIIVDWAGPAYEQKWYSAYAGSWPLVENSPGGYLNLWSQLASTLGTSVNKFSYVSFVPTWSAAGISYEDFTALPTEQQASMARIEAVRGAIAGSALSPYDRILAGTYNSPHASIPYFLTSPLVSEFRSAFAIPNYTWSPWYNRDDPSGNGDGEHRGLIDGVPCQNPIKAECRRVSDGVDSTRTGEIVRCTTDGGECINSQQTDLQCDNYEVRFACPL